VSEISLLLSAIPDSFEVVDLRRRTYNTITKTHKVAWTSILIVYLGRFNVAPLRILSSLWDLVKIVLYEV
jgi:hypothetical protein